MNRLLITNTSLILPLLIQASVLIYSPKASAVLAAHGVAACQRYIGTTQTDNSNIALGFAGGTMTNMTYSGGALTVSGGQTSGNFVSRAFDSELCTNVAPWTTFSFTPLRTELAPAATSLMTGLTALWHYNEAVISTPGSAMDSSGNGYHTECGSTYTTMPGLFGNAVSMTGNGCNIPNIPAFNAVMNSGVVTHSFWLRFRSTLGSYVPVTIWGSNSASGGFGFTTDNQSVSPGKIYLRIDTSAFLNQYFNSYLSSVSFNDLKWHHVAIVFNSPNVKVYFDGQLSTDGTYSPGAGFAGTNGAYYSANDDIDEAAVWNRALSAAEIAQVYRYGMGDVTLQVRGCTTAGCADNPAWAGPDGTNTTFYDATAAAPSFGLTTNGLLPVSVTSARFFQYKVIANVQSTVAPGVTAVSINRAAK